MFGLGGDDRIRRLERRVRMQDEVIDELCRKVGVKRDSADRLGGVDAEERALIADGKQIQAIKHHRERTGSGLVEAKEAIDAAAGGLGS